MKIFFGLFICLFFFGCADSAKNNNVEISPTPPIVVHDMSNTPEYREEIISKLKDDFIRNGINMSISGQSKDVLIVKSLSLKNDQIFDQIKNSIEAFRQIGFIEIQILDKSGKKQSIDLSKVEK